MEDRNYVRDRKFGKRLRYDDEATYASDLHLGDASSKDLAIPSSCQTGEVDWHYPTGTLTIRASKASIKSFDLCIGESWSTDIKSLYDVTAGHHKNISVPTTGKPSCARSVSGDVEILAHAIDTQLYMTTFTFEFHDVHNK
ncbi:uncharacterized protein LOC106013780 [Aplysia californica]|uniref:Uncharacterized protein LOC106013780 n=1 Tax=Aplysia californica TaxID=6500 RepID=A0ABM1W3X6_APLCA|nr:uncharacterized protein LOC106013780 [Aplysia californica]